MLSLWPNELRHAARALRRSPTFIFLLRDPTSSSGSQWCSGRPGSPPSRSRCSELTRRRTAVRSLIGWIETVHSVEAQGVSTMAAVTVVSGNYACGRAAPGFFVTFTVRGLAIAFSRSLPVSCPLSQRATGQRR